MDRDSITQTGARAPGVERNTARTEVPARPIVPDTEQGNPDGGRKHEGRWQTRTRGRPHLIFRPLSRTGENPPYGILGEAMETSASFEARSAPLSYPTAKERPYGSVRGAAGNRCPYRDNPSLHDVNEKKGVRRLTRSPERSNGGIAGIAFGDAFTMVLTMLRLRNILVTFWVEICSVSHSDRIFVTDNMRSSILF